MATNQNLDLGMPAIGKKSVRRGILMGKVYNGTDVNPYVRKFGQWDDTVRKKISKDNTAEQWMFTLSMLEEKSLEWNKKVDEVKDWNSGTKGTLWLVRSIGSFHNETYEAYADDEMNEKLERASKRHQKALSTYQTQTVPNRTGVEYNTAIDALDPNDPIKPKVVVVIEVGESVTPKIVGVEGIPEFDPTRNMTGE